MSDDLLDEIEEIAREQVLKIRAAVKGGFALDFEDVRKLETFERIVTRARMRREMKTEDMSKIDDATLEEILRKGMR